ncbi:hypothetical protein F5884DRAFT_712958 [Xylogone sp. PMI_703]|nr:hypothetical protein F5884DRAFT_712958 [Xylogone sp. PMI_703]
MSIRAAIWIFCSAGTLYLSKTLMVTYSFHYPFTISFLFFVPALLAYIISLSIPTIYLESDRKLTNNRTIPTPIYPTFGNIKSWLYTAPVAAVTAVAVPLFIQAILHLDSLPALMTLFPLAYTVEASILYSLHIFFTRSFSRRFPWEIYAATVALMGILYNEYRLTLLGLIFGLGSIALFGVSRALLSNILETSSCGIADQGRQNLLHSFTATTLILGTIISGILSCSIEHLSLSKHLSRTQYSLLFPSALLFTGSIFSGASLIQFSPISLKEDYDLPWLRAVSANELIISTASSLCIITLSLITSPTIFMSFTQIASFAVSVMLLLVYAQAKELSAPTVSLPWWREEFPRSEEEEQNLCLETIRKKQKSRAIIVIVLAPLIITSTWFLSTTVGHILNPIHSGIPAHLDSTYTSPPRRFDIVVSMYQEDPTSVIHALKTIKSIAPIKSLDPGVIVYTKSPDASPDILKSILKVDAVYKLDNLGREGATYLHHIVHNWDELAHQTLFIQANPHDIPDLVARIEDFLVPSTGMLSLGFAGVTCDCDTCADRWGWIDSFKTIPSLYYQLHNTTCSGQQVLLSYKGQFIASARRIRGIPREIYEDLLEALVSTEGWSHDGNIVGDNWDRPDTPFFGYTVERIWSLLMQCSGERVAALCPSLLIGWRNGGKLDGCQCLDAGLR